MDERVYIAESGTFQFALICYINLPPSPRGLRGPNISSAEAEEIVCSAGTEAAVQLQHQPANQISFYTYIQKYIVVLERSGQDEDMLAVMMLPSLPLD